MRRMTFGRLESVDDVDFTLPGDAPENARILHALRSRVDRPTPRVLVGTSGWSDRGLVGKLYAPGTRSADFLEQYGRVFPTNELNSTYYGVSRERIERWAAAVPESFRFCPKLPSSISHERELRGADAEMEEFITAVEGFGGRIGRLWSVLPPDFGTDRFGDLEAFLLRWAPRAPLAIELRHPSWFADRSIGDMVFHLFEELGVVAILTDVAGRRDVLHMRVTSPETMLRFVGNDLHPTDFERLDDWTERIAHWVDDGLEVAYVFLHQKDDAQTIDLAEHVVPRLAARTGLEASVHFRPPETDGVRQHELF